MDSEPLPAVKTTASGSSSVMDISSSSRVFVGGVGAQVKVRGRSGWCSSGFGTGLQRLCLSQIPPAVRTTRFRGCVSEAALNENNIGLWNYAERQGECGGCFMRWATLATVPFSLATPALFAASLQMCIWWALNGNGLLFLVHQLAHRRHVVPLRRQRVLCGAEVSALHVHQRGHVLQDSVSERPAAVPGLQWHGASWPPYAAPRLTHSHLVMCTRLHPEPLTASEASRISAAQHSTCSMIYIIYHKKTNRSNRERLCSRP